jgi:ring-1,2-phenylacetyl-CoA epoxidase subunit PaaD
VVAASLVEQKVWRLLADVPDPEIPILSVIDLGVVRYVRDEQDRGIAVGVSPTYTGCPATEVIQSSIKQHLEQAGFEKVRVDSVLAPPWTSDWLSDGAREKLRDYGIAPPAESVDNPRHLWADPTVRCPRCSSERTERVSQFASTPCKALYKCTSCLEPFEYFKCI